MRQPFQIVGARRFNDTVEGTQHNFTKVAVLVKHNDSQDKLGFDTVEIPFGTSDNFAKFDGVKFPVQAELDVEFTTKGLECKGFYPIKA